MVVARVVGGIGNQLFIYAAARRLALVNDVPLMLDTVSGYRWAQVFREKCILDRFNIRAKTASRWNSCYGPGGRVRRYLLRRINRALPFERRFYFNDELGRFDPRMLEVRVRRKVYLEGYWQSEKYFIDVADVIRKELEVVGDLGSRTRDEARMISKHNSVCLGIRRMVTGRERNTVRLGLEYYARAVEVMAHEVPDAHYFVVSNDPEWVKQHLRIPYPMTLISHKEDKERTYENLWLMTLCKHFIISESTYHWWGAWLSKNPGKRVIAPGPELAKTSPDFIPDDWIKLGAS